jgi:hypothetical protein
MDIENLNSTPPKIGILFSQYVADHVVPDLNPLACLCASKPAAHPLSAYKSHRTRPYPPAARSTLILA